MPILNDPMEQVEEARKREREYQERERLVEEQRQSEEAKRQEQERLTEERRQREAREAAEAVRLANEEKVSRTEFDKLDKTQQETLSRLGVSGFNALEEEKYRESIKNKYELKSGEWIDKAEYDKLSFSQKEYLDTNGIDAFNEKYGKRTYYMAGSKVETLETGPKLITPEVKAVEETKEEKLSEDQAKLKAIYDKQEEFNKLPTGQSVLAKLKDQFLHPLQNMVVKDKNGKYQEVQAGYAPGVGVSSNPQNFLNVLKVVVALSAAAVTPKFVSTVKSAVNEYASKNNEIPDTVTIVDKKNDAAITMQIPPTAKSYTETMPFEPVVITRLSTPMIKPVVINEAMTATSKLPDLPGFSLEKPDDIILWKTPKLVTDAEDFISKASAVTDSQAKVIKAVDTLPVDYNKILNKALATQKQDKIDKAFESIKDSIEHNQAYNYVTRNYLTLYQDYLRRQQILANARKALIASTDPAAVGDNAKYVYILAASKLATYINSKRGLTTKQKTALANKIASELGEGLSYSVAESLRNSLLNAVKAQTQTQTQTATATKTATKTATETQTAESTRPVDITRTNEATRTLEATMAIPLTRTAKAARALRVAKIARLKLPGGNKQEEPQKVVTDNKGVVVWEQGKLEIDPSKPGPETVYKVASPPGYKVKTSFRSPKGYKDTGDTPKSTIQTIGSPSKVNISVDIGITSARVDPDNKKITFSRRMPGISRRMPRIS